MCLNFDQNDILFIPNFIQDMRFPCGKVILIVSSRENIILAALQAKIYFCIFTSLEAYTRAFQKTMPHKIVPPPKLRPLL